METEKLIQSYVKDRYFVSTIHRESSGSHSIWHYETFVWEKDKKTGDYIKWVLDATTGMNSPRMAFQEHVKICKTLLAGKIQTNE